MHLVNISFQTPAMFLKKKLQKFESILIDVTLWGIQLISVFFDFLNAPSRPFNIHPRGYIRKAFWHEKYFCFFFQRANLWASFRLSVPNLPPEGKKKSYLISRWLNLSVETQWTFIRSDSTNASTKYVGIKPDRVRRFCLLFLRVAFVWQ